MSSNLEAIPQPMCLECASHQVMAWNPGQIIDGDTRRRWERDREFWMDEQGRWCKVHCTYLRRAVPFPLDLVECPWFETEDEAAFRAMRQRKDGA